MPHQDEANNEFTGVYLHDQTHRPVETPRHGEEHTKQENAAKPNNNLKL